MALKDAEGEVYTDEDEDGMIAEKDLKPGDYVACVMYDFDNETIYNPTNYATEVNVKDKVEYKKVENIKDKVKKNVEDEKPADAAPVEAVLDNTVEYDGKDIAQEKDKSIQLLFKVFSFVRHAKYNVSYKILI